VGRATLYRHFPTREQLLQALSVTELLFLLGQLPQAAARMTAEHVAGLAVPFGAG
jgi:AcrR family transcriptional regulator